jgi:hypothetical protein
LCASSAGDEEASSFELQQIDGSRIQAARPAARHLHKIVVAQAQAKCYQDAESFIEYSLKNFGFSKNRIGFHAPKLILLNFHPKI